MVIEPVHSLDSAVVALLEQSDAFYAALYPAESNHLDSVAELSASHVVFLGCWSGPELVGCGAIKWMRDDGDYAEIKRLFVKPRFRGQGLSRRLMAVLEDTARQHAMPVIRLETGTRQPEALALYRSLGYRTRGPFGSYLPDPLSVFMEKRLQTPVD